MRNSGWISVVKSGSRNVGQTEGKNSILYSARIKEREERNKVSALSYYRILGPYFLIALIKFFAAWDTTCVIVQSALEITLNV